MTEPTLKQIIKLFSVFCQFDFNQPMNLIKLLIKEFITKHTKEIHIDPFLNMFDFYISQGAGKEKKFYKNLTLNAVKAIGLINSINKHLDNKEKYWVLIQLFKMLKLKKHILDEEFDFVETVAISFKIKETEFYNLKHFILNNWEDIPDKQNILIINNQKPNYSEPIKHIYRENLSGFLCILFIRSINQYLFYYKGKAQLFLNEHAIVPNSIYALDKGNSISSFKMGLHNLKLRPIYYTEIGMEFFKDENFKKIILELNDVEYGYNNSDEGIKPFKFSTESFLLVGIIGSSGAGKTTLLNILNGNLKPQKGKVFINGYDLHDPAMQKKLKGLIGYVPQDDLLIEELTVYQNLYYNAKLCFYNKSKSEIDATVIKMLQDLELYHIKSLKVGDETNQIISGGQRKRLNIGIELMREPAILLIDEPTSGLSSMDSIKIINILREQTFKGKLVIVNIHQPSSNLFRLLDQLIVIDKGGYIAYIGDPLESFVYFKTLNQQINPTEKECPVCGNIEPETILEILEEKALDENGNSTQIRKISPEKWHKLHIENQLTKNQKITGKRPLPQINFQIPPAFIQFNIFSLRNLKAKLSNKQYLWVTLLETPLLALILGYFSKYNAGTADMPEKYIFSENVNIPAYLLMSIIVVLFIGLLISAKEIISDHKILAREKFLNLSKLSYINSKVFFLFVLSAVQTFLYVIIGNHILEINSLHLSYWIILFSIACSANLLGLIISSALKSTITIYILIPFLIIPQILLSGSIIKFDQLNSRLTSKIYPPLIADFIPSRWAFESLAVVQFENNEYEKHFFAIEKFESNISYQQNYWLPELHFLLKECIQLFEKNKDKDVIYKNILFIISELEKNNTVNHKALKTIQFIKNQDSIEQQIQLLDDFFANYQSFLSDLMDKALSEKDVIVERLVEKTGNLENYQKFKSDNLNNAVKDLVLRQGREEKLIKDNNTLIRVYEPIYITTDNKFGRAPLFSSEKKIFHVAFSTYHFNVFIIWVINFFLYLILTTDMLNIILNKLHLKKTIHSFIKKE